MLRATHNASYSGNRQKAYCRYVWLSMQTVLWGRDAAPTPATATRRLSHTQHADGVLQAFGELCSTCDAPVEAHQLPQASGNSPEC